MKKTLIFGLIAASALLVAPAHAQIPTPETASKTAPVTAPETPISLTARKAKAETDLRALESQFRLFVTRTQLTIDRLTTKGVDTTEAQAKLAASLASLNTAKANLDVFTTIVVTDSLDEKAIETATLTAAMVTIQDNLKLARTNLIESLTALKSSVALTQ